MSVWPRSRCLRKVVRDVLDKGVVSLLMVP